MVITAEWSEVTERIARSKRRPLVVMVIGAVDTGKTTFCTSIAKVLFERGLKVAVVDADLGQSDIGLPTTIGIGFIQHPIKRLRDVPCSAAYFVGTTSPAGHLLPTITGTKLMAERALALGADAVVVDTDGLVHGGVGWALKQHTFELLRPTHVVLLQRTNELAAFAKQWKDIVWTEVLEAPVPKVVTEKTREQRRLFREQRLREWLSQCGELILPLSQIRFRNATLGQGVIIPKEGCKRLSQWMGAKVVHAERVNDTALVFVEAPPISPDFESVRSFFGGAPFVRWVTPSRYEQVIVGLLDRNDELLTVGITFRLDFSEGVLSVLALPVPTEQIRTVAFGAVLLALDGTELGTLSSGSL